MPRIPMIAGNWKMNGSVREAEQLARAIVGPANGVSGVEKVVCPPFISLVTVGDVLRGSTVSLGAQNMYHIEKGPYTGEISPVMLSELCQYVILGHSERRLYFGETDESVNLKVKAALAYNLSPIVCVGENLAQREERQTEAVVGSQTRGGFHDVAWSSSIVVAYEPVWAIGTGRAATSEIAQDTIAFIRRELTSLFGENEASQTRILYGGSVTPDNIKDLISRPDIDGGLVGGASLSAESFISIVRQSAGG